MVLSPFFFCLSFPDLEVLAGPRALPRQRRIPLRGHGLRRVIPGKMGCCLAVLKNDIIRQIVLLENIRNCSPNLFLQYGVLLTRPFSDFSRKKERCFADIVTSGAQAPTFSGEKEILSPCFSLLFDPARSRGATPLSRFFKSSLHLRDSLHSIGDSFFRMFNANKPDAEKRV